VLGKNVNDPRRLDRYLPAPTGSVTTEIDSKKLWRTVVRDCILACDCHSRVQSDGNGLTMNMVTPPFDRGRACRRHRRVVVSDSHHETRLKINVQGQVTPVTLKRGEATRPSWQNIHHGSPGERRLSNFVETNAYAH
jgi:hypothetical protein